jgi:hypothetical protein
MAETIADFSNPYAAPAPVEEGEAVAGPAQSPITREVWLATTLVWTGCGTLACAAAYVLLAWVEHRFPRLSLGIERADQLAQFATGAANAVAMAGLFAYAQYHAVIRRDLIWSRTLALLLVIGSLVISLGAVLMFPGQLLMWALLLPAGWSAVLSALMFRWHGRLVAFRRQQRRLARR